jgi:hypothetical protein
VRHEKYLVSGKIPAVLSSQRSRFTSSFPPDERSTVNENFLPVASRGRSDIVLPENFEENEERISKTTQSVVSFGGEGVVSRCLKNQCQDQCSLSANAKWMVRLGVEKSRVRQNGSASVLSSVRSKRLRSATVATEVEGWRRLGASLPNVVVLRVLRNPIGSPAQIVPSPNHTHRDGSRRLKLEADAKSAS